MLTYYIWKVFVEYDLEYNSEISLFTIIEILLTSIFSIPIDIIFLPLELLVYCIYKIVNKRR